MKCVSVVANADHQLHCTTWEQHLALCYICLLIFFFTLQNMVY